MDECYSVQKNAKFQSYMAIVTCLDVFSCNFMGGFCQSSVSILSELE